MLSLTQWGGAGDAAVFLHGFGADSQSWVANVSAVTQHCTVVGVDLPGHGQSHAVLSAPTLNGIADQVAVVLEDYSPCHLIGHSLGGAIAMLCAEKLPLLSLSLISPAGLGQGVQDRFIDSLTALENDAEAKQLLRSMVCNKRLISDVVVTRLLEHLKTTGVRENLRRIGGAMQQSGDVQSQSDLHRAISTIQARDIPRQVFWGLQDTINPLLDADAASFGGEWHLFDNCGHLPQIEQWSGYNDALSKFITN